MKAVATMFALILFLAFLSRAHADCAKELTALNNETSIKVRLDTKTFVPIVGYHKAGATTTAQERALYERAFKICALEGRNAIMKVGGGTFEAPMAMCSIGVKKLTGELVTICDPRDASQSVELGLFPGMK